MTPSLLTDLLARQLIEIESDDQLQKLQATSRVLAGKLRSKRLAAANCTLVAMDPDVESSEPVLVAAMSELSSNWKTVRAKYAEPPVTLLRAVVTDALEQACSDSDIAGIVWLIGTSYFPISGAGRELELWERILAEAGTKSDSAASAAWQGEMADPKDEKTRTPTSGRAPHVNTDSLALHLGAAAGPVEGAPAGTSPNQHQISAQYAGTANPAWAQAFGAGAAATIGAVINAALKRMSDVLHTEIGTVSHTLSSTRAIDLRSKVLWWKEALYSSSLQAGYRDLDAAVAAVAMAYDLACLVPAHSPRSLDFIITEAARKLFGSVKPKTVEAYCLTLAENADLLTPLLGKGRLPDGRVTLSEYFRLILTGNGDVDLTKRTGIPEDHSLSIPDFTRWIFRDFQAGRLAGVK